MALPARPLKQLPESSDSSLPPNLPVIVNARDILPEPPQSLRLAAVPPQPDAPPSLLGGGGGRKKESGVLRGIKDLQQLQKQTIAVLEAIKGGLEEIHQVLRSPEATRGLEKQHNAAMLLAKGFARDAVEQAHGAVTLLPANPDAHLLLALGLAADQQFDAALATARKGLALFDRRVHPLAIEAGLLHALAALGCGQEAVERWAAIIDALPLPLIFEHLGRIAACFPPDAPEGRLDDLINRRLLRHQHPDLVSNPKARLDKSALTAEEFSAQALFNALDAAQHARLPITHRALLGLIAQRLKNLDDPSDLLRFLTEYVVPLSNRDLGHTAHALGRAATKRLLINHADAMILFRAAQKLQMAGDDAILHDVVALLRHWRKVGNRRARAKGCLWLGTLAMAAGSAMLYATSTALLTMQYQLPAIGLMTGGALLTLYTLLTKSQTLMLPYNRRPLTAEERASVNSSEVKQFVRGVLSSRKR